MQCRFCLLQNTGDEERCPRCGKRLNGNITSDGIGLAGATALAPRRRSREIEGQVVVLDEAQTPTVHAGPGAPLPAHQALLFNGLFTSELSSNVIPFDSIPRAIQRPEIHRNLPAGPAAKQLTAAKQAIRKQSAARRSDSASEESQGRLNLEFLAPAPPAPRTLKTTVEASIYCDAPVAAPMHRSVAAILDMAMILIGCGLFLGIFQYFGVGVRVDRFDVLMFVSAVILITMFYGFLFAWARCETPGQHWTELRLINFDGFPPNGASRALRYAGCWLGFCAGGVGLLWALLDEENLTWHDHMSKTFLTMREPDTPFFRERPS